MSKNERDTIRETSSIRSIKYLALQGGGMKGIGYVGVIEELEKKGVLAQLAEVAGSSAGGILALLLAIGCTADEIRTHMLALNFQDFQDRDEPGWIESTHLKDLFSPVGFILDTLDDKLKLLGTAASYIMTPVSLGLKAASAASSVFSGAERIEQGIESMNTLGFYKGDVLSYWLANIVAQKTGKPNLTFAELAKLSSVPNSPFKKLTLTGSNLTANRLDYFNAEDYPDMPIVEAARITASFPGAFRPVRRPDKNGVMSVYVDGGLVENLPDVFHRPPYVAEDQSRNDRAFAVVFKSLKEMDSEKREINNVLDLCKALYSSMRSEKRIYERYASNIAYVDTAGVNTLEFGLTEDKKEALVAAGRRAIDGAFKNILKAELELDYSKLNLKALIRIKVGLHEEKRRDPKWFDDTQQEEQLMLIERAIGIHRKAGRISEEDLLKLYQAEERELEQRLQSQDEKVLLNSFQKKLEEFDRIRTALIDKLRALRLVEQGLQLRREEVLAQFGANDFNNPFFQALNDSALTMLYEQLQANRREIAHLSLTAKTEREGLESRYQDLIKEHREKLLSLKAQFSKTKSDIEAQYFEDLLRAADSPAKIPNTSAGIRQYYEADIKVCRTLGEETNAEIEKMQAEREGFKKAYQHYRDSEEERQKNKQDGLAILTELRKDLNMSLQEKSRFAAKLNYSLSQRLPFFSGVITGFFKLVTFASFVAFLPLAIPSVAIAKGVRYFSSNTETQTLADRFVNFFRRTDVDFEKKLRGFTRRTAEFVQLMTNNYTKDKSENAYIYKLFSQYLKDSGLKLADILSKKTHETDAQYQERLKRIEKALNVPDAASRALIIKGYETQEKQAKNKEEAKIQSFRVKVLEDVLKISEHQSKYEYTKNLALARERNLSQIDLDYVQEFEKKLRAENSTGGFPSLKEKRDYVRSNIALGRELNADFRKKYGDALSPDLKALYDITLKIKKDTELTKEEVEVYKQYIESRRKTLKSRSSEEQQIFSRFNARYIQALPPLPREYKAALDNFVKKRREDESRLGPDRTSRPKSARKLKRED